MMAELHQLHARPERCRECGIPLLAMYRSEVDRTACAKCVRLERNAQEVAGFLADCDDEGPSAA